MRGLDHLRDFKSRIGRDRMAPKIGESPRVFVVDRKSTGKFIGLRAAFAAPLDAAVAANGHDPTLLAAQHAARQGEIDDRWRRNPSVAEACHE